MSEVDKEQKNDDVWIRDTWKDIKLDSIEDMSIGEHIKRRNPKNFKRRYKMRRDYHIIYKRIMERKIPFKFTFKLEEKDYKLPAPRLYFAIRVFLIYNNLWDQIAINYAKFPETNKCCMSIRYRE